MIRVLVVDDDLMVAKLHSRYVAAAQDFEVAGVAHSGAEALEAVQRLRPDLVLLDVHLPDMDGIEVLRALRAAGLPETDVLMITASRDAETIRGAVRGGALHYVIKPFTQAALHEQLRHYATMRSRLASLGGAAGQPDVDQVFGSRPTVSRLVPKGLDPRTADLVERVLRAHPEGLSAAECAARAEISRVAARRYLEHFTETGRAELSLRYGGTGRPVHRYRWL
ncbi:response regulator [Streptomyces polyrhachis]|uniref:Transcriptional regulatory protein n=1 Tax=Streptomyces polyrhachis TaxID=1282885 RepID=A0ABW2GA42_9ACTN